MFLELRFIRSSWIFFLIFIYIFFIGCSKGEGKAQKTIKVVGSTTVLPVVTKAGEIFMRKHPDVSITINSGGSGVGVTSVAKGLSDIGMISRDISGDEKKRFSNIDFTVYDIGKDAVACVVSAPVYNSGIKALSRDTIKKIYLGEIKNWKEIGGIDKDILVIDKESHRGTRHIFMQYLFGDENAKAPGADIVTGSNNEEQSKIAQSDSAIGMLSHAWINKDVIGIGIIEVDGKIIEPTIENIKNGSYPIARNLSLITSGEASGVIREFIDFIVDTEGQHIVEENGYVTRG